MARPPKSIQVITANRLLDGRVVFLTGADRWDERVDAAKVYADPVAAEAGVAVAQASAAAGEVVEPYAIAVSYQSGRIVPTSLRERIRAEGPTIDAGSAAKSDAAAA